jgi:hypothetical protein
MSIATKIEKLLTARDAELCYMSRAEQTIIDVIHPNTGRTMYSEQTLDEVRERYPDAEEMTVDAFCDWMAAQQRTAITWRETTEESYNDALGALPPVAYGKGGAFLLGEPWDHDAGNGQPRYTAYRIAGGDYYESSRPMTRAEFRAELEAK